MYAIINMGSKLFAVEIDVSNSREREYIETFVNEGTPVQLTDDYEYSGAELTVVDFYA